MEEDKEEKLKCEGLKENTFLRGGKVVDRRSCYSKQNYDHSEEKLTSSVDSGDISPTHGRVLGKKYVCKVCYKEFQSVKAVHGHMRLHSGKKKVDEEPGSSSCKNSAFSCNSNGETSSLMTIEPSSILRSNQASQSLPSDFIAYGLEYELDARIGALNLFMMARGITEIDQNMNFPRTGTEFKVKLQFNISESTGGYSQKQSYEVSENRSRSSNLASEEEETHKPNGVSERPISSVESGINLNLADADSSEKEEFQRKSKKPRRNSYKCKICSKSFLSYQALGGHSIVHKDVRKRRMK